MPREIISRLITKVHKYLLDQRLVWQKGIVLKNGETMAEIIKPYGGREIQIRITGSNPKELLTIITYELDKIHQSIPNLKVKKLIPCICRECREREKPYFFEYNGLEKRRAAGKKEAECNISFEDIKVNALMDEVTYIPARQRSPKVFISSCRDDQKYLDELKKQLAGLERQGKARIWDNRQIPAGTEQKSMIRENMQDSDIVLLIISPDYVADTDGYFEMSLAIDHLQNTKSKVIPIMASSFRLDTTPLAGIRAIPSNGETLFNFDKEGKNREKAQAYNEVVSLVKEVINEQYGD